MPTTNEIEQFLKDSFKPAKVNFAPNKDYYSENREFQGIPGIAITPNGRLWATWYSGGTCEGVDNYTLLVHSDDDGDTWSKPVAVVDIPGPLRTFDPVLWLDNNGRLWWFWTQGWSGEQDILCLGGGVVWAIICDDPDADQCQWSDPFSISQGIMMNKPTIFENGDYIFPTALWSWDLCCNKHLTIDGLDPFVNRRYSNMTVSRDNGKTFETITGPRYS
ncbi:MAG: sialidase family protein [Candidatus Theseobacter exili]|nr:sialidase family protein [Candidatus Theseobacter exili]